MDSKYLLPAFVLAIAQLLTFTGCGGENARIGGSGLLEADEAIVSAETVGRVVLLRFDEGSQVKRGDTLLTIDPSRLELELASALAGKEVVQARLQTAKLQFEKSKESERFAQAERDRIATLVKSGTATKKQLDQLEHEYALAVLGRQGALANISASKAELEKIKADINRIRRQLKDCYPVSPMAGTITEKYVKAGELLQAGRPIAKISGLDTLWVKAYLPAADLVQIKVGDKATVDTESGGRNYTGKVVWTSEEAEFTPKNVQTKKSRANLVYAVKVRIPNTDGMLKIGMPVFVTIER